MRWIILTLMVVVVFTALRLIFPNWGPVAFVNVALFTLIGGGFFLQSFLHRIGRQGPTKAEIGTMDD